MIFVYYYTLISMIADFCSAPRLKSNRSWLEIFFIVKDIYCTKYIQQWSLSYRIPPTKTISSKWASFFSAEMDVLSTALLADGVSLAREVYVYRKVSGIVTRVTEQYHLFLKCLFFSKTVRAIDLLTYDTSADVSQIFLFVIRATLKLFF